MIDIFSKLSLVLPPCTAILCSFIKFFRNDRNVYHYDIPSLWTNSHGASTFSGDRYLIHIIPYLLMPVLFAHGNWSVEYFETADTQGFSTVERKKIHIKNTHRECNKDSKIKYDQAFDCVDHSKLWKILKEMGIPDHLTCLLRNLSVGHEATVRTGHGTIDWFQIGKGVRRGCILSPCLFNLYAEYIMRNAGLDEAQAGIKVARRNINNLIYADDTTFMAESEEELKSFLMKVKEESENWLKTQHSEN